MRKLSVYILLLFCAFAGVSSCKTSPEAESETMACWHVKGGQLWGMRAYMACDTVPVVEYRAICGRELNPAMPGTSTMYCDIDDGLMYGVAPERTVCIKVGYLDKGYSGFALCYESHAHGRRGEYVQLHNSGDWKEHTFVLYDAVMANGTDGADFVLTTHDMDVMGKANGPVAISSVKVELAETLSPYELTVAGNRTGNIFFDDEEVVFKVKCHDVTGKTPCRELVYVAVDENGESVCSGKRQMRGDSVEIELPSLPYGVYELMLEMSGDGACQRETVDFSRSRRAAEINTRFGTNLHFDWVVYDCDDIEHLAGLVRDAGYGFVRTSLRWNQMEKSEGDIVLPDNILNANKCLKKHGLKMVGILNQECPLYDTVPYWLESESKRAAYARYCNFVVDALKEYTDLFTYPNEFNLTRGGVHNAGNYRQNMDIIKAAYPAIKKANPDAFIIAGAVSRYDEPYLQGLFKMGVGECCDAVSIHLYDFIAGPETYYTNKPDLNMYPNAQLFRNLMKRSLPHAQAWITENGWCSFPGDLSEAEAHRNFFMCTENEQARWYARSFIVNSDPGRADRYFHYSFVNNEVGYFNRESNFGIIHSHNHRTPFSAKPAFVTVAAFNAIVGNARFKGNVEELELPEDERNHFAYLFENSNGEEIACFWQRDDRLLTDRSQRSYTYRSDMPYLEIYDMYGNMTVVDNSEGSYTSLYTSRPVYIKGVKERAE